MTTPESDTHSYSEQSNNGGGNSDNQDPFIDSELADVFDRYSSALDSGDDQAAEAILAEYPAISEEFRAPLRGLYLLGRAAQEQNFTLGSGSEAPMRLGDFEIEHELGRGGMGIVYAAKQISLQRRVALKILPFTSVLDPRQVARFRNEAQAAASLHHTNIVPVYGVGCERGVHYYSMQLIEGQTLAEFVEQFKRIEKGETRPLLKPNAETANALSTVASIKTSNYVKNIVEIGARVAEAIDFAHEHGIVHRDIKPSNLLLDQTGKIWVADFGLARGRETSNLTSQGDQLGTLRYMSPEQAAGRNNLVDFRTDIYSLGISLCELLTLRPAFGATDRIELLAAIEAGNPIPLRSVNPSIPFDLETVINKAIEKEPSQRYESAQAFASDLIRCLEGKPVVAKRKTMLDRCVNAVAKHKWLFAGLASALIGIAVTTSVIASVFYNQREREHMAAENARFYLQQAHQSVEEFGAILTDELTAIPGTNELRARLLSKSIGYYDDFLKFADDAPDLVFEQAQAYIQLASLYERAGDDAQALANYDSAIESLANLPETPEAKLEVAICFDRLGLLQKRRGEFAESKSSFNKAIEHMDQLRLGSSSLNDDKLKTGALVVGAQTYSNLAMLHWAKGELRLATLSFEKSLSQLNPILEGAIGDQIASAEIRSTYFKINGNYVSVLQELDVSRAEQVLLKSIFSLKQSNLVLANQSTDSIRKNSSQNLIDENSEYIADMKNNLALILCHENRFESAKEYAAGAIEYWKQRHKTSPLGMNSAERLATAYNTLGEIHWRAKSARRGDESFVQAERILRQVIKLLPNRPETISRLAGVLHNRSLVAFQSSRVDEATNSIGLAIEFQNQAISMVAQNSRYKKMLNEHKDALKAFTSEQPASSEQKRVSQLRFRLTILPVRLELGNENALHSTNW